MKTYIECFVNNDAGVTTVEYAVMLALIALVCIAAIVSLGGETNGFWNRSADAISGAVR